MLSVGKAARLLAVTPATVRHWTEIGLLPCTRTAGGHRRIAREDVLELARAIGGGTHATVRQARERELETLVASQAAVAGQLELPALLAEIAKHVTRLFGCHTCSISSYDDDAATVTTLAEYDAGGRRTPTTGTFDLHEYPETLRRLREQTTGVINADDPRIDPAERTLLKRYGDMSVLEVPLVFHGVTVGLLEAIDQERSRTYSRQELRLVTALAGQAAVSLRNAELYEAATRSDTAMAALQGAMKRIAAASAGRGSAADGGSAAGGPPGATTTALNTLAAALRDGLGARSVVISRGGAVLGAATAASPARGSAESENGAAYLLTATHDAGVDALEITVVATRPSERGQAELLDMTAALTVLLLSPSRPGATG